MVIGRGTLVALLGLTLAVAVEGPLATLAAGGVVSTSGAPAAAVLGLAAVVLAAVVVADVAADSAYFSVGRALGSPRGRRLVRRLPVSDARLGSGARSVAAHFPLAMAGIKIADAAAVPVLVAAGRAGIPYRRFLAWDLVVTLPRAAVLLTVGALAGPGVAAAVGRLGPAASVVVLVSLICAVVIATVVRRRVSAPPHPPEETP